MVQPLWKIVWPFLNMLNINFPYNPATILLGIQLGEMRTHVHTRSGNGKQKQTHRDRKQTCGFEMGMDRMWTN